MKRNFITKTLPSLLILGTCLIGFAMPVFADNGSTGWIDCDTSKAGAGTFIHPWAYEYPDGTQAHDGWYFIDGNWYYFKHYTISYGEQEINGKWYFFDYDTGHLLMNQYAPVGRNTQIWANANGELPY